jgi:hypothetical protein
MNTTVVITTCGRFDLFERTFRSFVRFNTSPVKFIIADNSTDSKFQSFVRELTADCDCRYLFHDTNIGQVSSIDSAYNLVDTEFIFHLEEDWQFSRSGFIEESIKILNFNSKTINVSCRRRFDSDASGHHPVSDILIVDGVEYRLYDTHYHGIWHGFSWNPGLRRTSDYQLFKPYKQFQNEQGVGAESLRLGFRSACLNHYACYHIGAGFSTFKRNE